MSATEQTIGLHEIEEARKYAEGHKKWANLMYGAILKDIGKFNIKGRYLEIGAGPGLLAAMVARQNPEVTITAVDLSPGMYAVAEEYIAEQKLKNRINYILGDSGDEKLMNELGKFDFVYSTFSLHDWAEPEQAVRNLWESVAENGVLYIFDFKKIGWLCKLPANSGEIKAMRTSFSPEEARALIQKVGIKEYKVKTVFPYIFQSIIAWK